MGIFSHIRLVFYFPSTQCTIHSTIQIGLYVTQLSLFGLNNKGYSGILYTYVDNYQPLWSR